MVVWTVDLRYSPCATSVVTFNKVLLTELAIIFDLAMFLQISYNEMIIILRLVHIANIINVNTIYIYSTMFYNIYQLKSVHTLVIMLCVMH